MFNAALLTRYSQQSLLATVPICPHHAGEEDKTPAPALAGRGHQRRYLRDDLHRAEHVGMHDAVELGLGGRLSGAGAAHDTGHVQRDVDGLAIELPGQAADAGRLGDIHFQTLGTKRPHPGQALLIPSGGDDARAGLGVLADQFQADAARGADDQNGAHG
jgi:hypothetical protein